MRRCSSWNRQATGAAAPRPDAGDRSDARWVWVAVLALLALETWMRRTRLRPPWRWNVPAWPDAPRDRPVPRAGGAPDRADRRDARGGHRPRRLCRRRAGARRRASCPAGRDAQPDGGRDRRSRRLAGYVRRPGAGHRQRRRSSSAARRRAATSSSRRRNCWRGPERVRDYVGARVCHDAADADSSTRPRRVVPDTRAALFVAAGLVLAAG